jgi:hypothetical protein
MRWAGREARKGKMHKAFLLKELEGNVPLGRYSCRLKDNIKMDLNEIGC